MVSTRKFHLSKYITTVVFGLLLSLEVSSQHQVQPPQNTFARDQISLNGQWQYFVDRYEAFYFDFLRTPFDVSELGKTDFAALDAKAKNKSDRYEYGFDGADSLSVPGDWNNQKEKLFYYEGSIWYKKKFNTPKITSNTNLILYFGAANYSTDVYVNGKKAGSHKGGFTPFAFNITPLLTDDENSLVVRVDNKRHRDAVPTDVTDWWNYGGLTRDVKLLLLPDEYIENYHLQLDPEQPKSLKGFITLSDSIEKTVTIHCEELNLKITGRTDANGTFQFSKNIKRNIDYWSPENPKRYTFKIVTETDIVIDKIGLRTIETRGNQLLLNNKAVFLRGICAHEENSENGGRASTKTDALRLLESAKELNANFMRLAHYPHNEYMPRLADSLGMLLWEEIPVYWTIDWENEETYKLAEQQLKEMIERDRNRASVIIWSLANETPTTEPRLQFLKNLAKTARSLDSSRLLSAALFKKNLGNGNYTITDPFSEYTDLVSFNQYLGWYEGLPDILGKSNFTFSSNKPVFVSEFGAGAKAGYRADSLTRWSENFQDYLYEETLDLMDRIPNLVGFSPWILYDFRSPRRQLPTIQEGWNRKGIIGQNGKRKMAFYRLQKYYEQKKKESNKQKDE